MTTNFEKATNHHDYWLKQDCLHPINYDVYVSLGTRYYCNAGCKVCYIDKNFAALKNNLPSYHPEVTEKHEEMWKEIFDHFLVVRTNDDMMFLKYTFPKSYDWYRRNASWIEYCFTDNAIFRTAQLVKELKFKAIANITISSVFAESVNQDKLIGALEKINDVSPILKIKFINCGNIKALDPYIELANKNNLNNILHHDFTQQREVYDYDWMDEQTTWVDSDENGLMQIYREAVHLYFDRFYYSSDDASDVSEEPFYCIEDKFDRNLFLANLIKGKQNRYKRWATRTKNDKFVDYFNTTQQYEVNENFNFIPGLILAPYSRFFYKMLEDGWIRTPYGIVKPGSDKLVSIIEHIK